MLHGFAAKFVDQPIGELFETKAHDWSHQAAGVFKIQACISFTESPRQLFPYIQMMVYRSRDSMGLSVVCKLELLHLSDAGRSLY